MCHVQTTSLTLPTAGGLRTALVIRDCLSRCNGDKSIIVRAFNVVGETGLVHYAGQLVLVDVEHIVPCMGVLD